MAKKTGDRLAELVKNHGAVADSLSAIGANGQRTDGLGTLAEKARNAVVVKGTVKSVKVSSAGTVFQGDRVKRAKEFSSGTQIRFAVDNTTVIAAKKLKENCLVFLFGQDGNTYLKAARRQGDSWTLGNTLLILENDVPLAASIVPLPDSAVAVLYNSDAAGVLTKVTFNDLTATLAFSDIFDVYDPVNIAADCWVSPYAKPPITPILVASFVRHGTDYAGKAYLLALSVGTTLAIGVPTELALTEIKKNDDGTPTEVPVDLGYSRDEYARAWDIAVYGSTIYLSFFRGYSKERGLLVAGRKDLQITCRRFQNCNLSGSLPAVAMCTVPGVLDGSVALAHGITRVQNKVTKSLLGVEMWHGLEETDRLLPLCFGEEDVTYNINIGRACVGALDRDTLVVGYSINNAMRVMAIDVRGFHSVGGPSVQVCSFNSFAEIVPLDVRTAALIYQYNGSGYIKLLNLQNVVFSTTDDESDGVAKTGGGSGSMIQIYEAG